MISPLFVAAVLSASAFAQTATTPIPAYWLRMYPLPAYGEIWRLTVSVPDFKKGLQKALALLDKKGQSVLPMQNMAGSDTGGFQQLSYRLPANAAPKVFSSLQKLGEVEDLQKNPAFDPRMRDEVREKLTKLRAERDDHEIALSDSSVIRAALEEIITHLESVEKTDREAQGRILLNVQIQAKAMKP